MRWNFKSKKQAVLGAKVSEKNDPFQRHFDLGKTRKRRVLFTMIMNARRLGSEVEFL